MKRVAAGKGNSGNIRLVKLFENLLPGAFVKVKPSGGVPCNGIVAGLTAMGASGYPKYYPKAVAV